MRRAISTVLAVAFSTMSVLACGSDTPTDNGTPTAASVVVTPANAPLVSLEETVRDGGRLSGARLRLRARALRGIPLRTVAFLRTRSGTGP